MNKTSIEWTDFTWNPVTGCNKVSQGCKNCYAETIANRFWGDRKFTDVIMHEDRLNEPKKNIKKWAGKKVFVCSMSDLFHESVSFDFIDQVYLNMLWNTIDGNDVTFQILTKRPDRALQFYQERCPGWMIDGMPKNGYGSNIWIGTSCEDQATADLRIPLLLQIPAAVRFLSCEPLLGAINLVGIQKTEKTFIDSLRGNFVTIAHDCKQLILKGNKIDWVIAGGESGHGARPMHPDWVRSLRDQCESAKVPFFFKQWGNWVPSHCVNEIDWPKQFQWLRAEDGKFYKNVSKGPEGCYQSMFKVGKSKAGHVLDGREHHEFPCLTSHV